MSKYSENRYHIYSFVTNNLQLLIYTIFTDKNLKFVSKGFIIYQLAKDCMSLRV